MKTMYTVPPHVGDCVEVSYYMNVSFYDPKIRVTSAVKPISSPGACVDTAAGESASVNSGFRGNTAISLTAQPEVKYIYFRSRSDSSSTDKIQAAFQKSGASVEVIDTDSASWLVKL